MFLKHQTLILFPLLCLPLSGTTAPIVSSQTEYYPVCGNTVEEIRSDMDMKSPVHVHGFPYDAHTSWTIKWDFRWRGSGGTCKITELKVKVTIQQILPRLIDSVERAESVQEIWNSYTIALLHHEQEQNYRKSIFPCHHHSLK